MQQQLSRNHRKRKQSTKQGLHADVLTPGLTHVRVPTAVGRRQQHRSCYNRAVILNRRDFVVVVVAVFLVLMALLYLFTAYKMTCGWRGTAGSALLNKRLVTIIRRRVRTAMQRRTVRPAPGGHSGCAARASAKAASTLGYYSALGKT